MSYNEVIKAEANAIYRKNMRSGNIGEATAAWEKEMFDEKVEEVA